ncbi:protein of unknown function [Brochothrix thermosphacta]|nr:protein of unknown function [Brochothrix thermosphacta]
MRWSINSIQTRGNIYGIKRSYEAERYAHYHSTLFTDTQTVRDV